MKEGSSFVRPTLVAKIFSQLFNFISSMFYHTSKDPHWPGHTQSQLFSHRSVAAVARVAAGVIIRVRMYGCVRGERTATPAAAQK
jgi:hypothetical protein